MDLNSIHQKSQKSLADIATDALWLKSTSNEKNDKTTIGDQVPESDSAGATELDKLKLQVQDANEPGRASYLEKLKAAVASGKLEVPAENLADALIEDGFLEFLID